MCGTCNSSCSKGSCVMHVITMVLVIVGGINWGLVGLGMLLGYGSAWNLVTLLVGSMPVVEAVVYLLVGVSAILLIFGCKCKKCTVAPVETAQATQNPTV